MEFANNYANTRNSPRIASSLHNSTIPKICEHMKLLAADKREKPMDLNLKDAYVLYMVSLLNRKHPERPSGFT